MKYDYLVVGAGPFGAVFAHEAHKRGKSVLVIDRRIILQVICIVKVKTTSTFTCMVLTFPYILEACVGLCESIC